MTSETFLLSPGPVNIPLRVVKAMSRTSLHHRTGEFSNILNETLENLKIFYGTIQPVLPLHCTGRGAMEATIVNLFSQGEQIVSICNGKFGGMYADIAQAMGLKVHRLSTNWTEDVDLSELDRVLASNPSIKAVTVVYTET
jgi:aspartate aminotransferase-like enzyme